MKKIYIKWMIVLGVLFVINTLLYFIVLPMYVIVIAFCFALILLVSISYALITEFNIFQRLSYQGRNSKYLSIKYKHINVSYLWKLNGGGIGLSYEFVHIVSQKIGKVGHVFEYCAGPGFIGFNLLANNLCEKLTLTDINPQAIEAIKETIKQNNLEDKVTVYQSDGLDSIPLTEQWDLVVGNPPWLLSPKKESNIILRDSKAEVHQKFYRDIKKFLKPEGSILFVESGEFTNINSFKEMIQSNGLRIIESIKKIPFLKVLNSFKEYQGPKVSLLILLQLGLFIQEIYFVWVKRK